MQGLIAFYPTASLDDTKAFYHDILEFKVSLDQGSCLIFEVPGGGHIGFCEHLQCLDSPENLYITWVTDQVDRWYAHLVKHKQIALKTPAVNEKFRIYQTLFRDNNGYTVEIQKFLDDC